MINPLSSHLPASPASSTELERLFALLHFFNDPKAVKERVSQIMQVAADSAKIVEEAEAVRAEFAQERESLKAERVKQASQIAADRKAFETQCNHRDGVINQRAEETSRLNETARAKLAEAERLRLEAEQRVEKIKAAAA